MFCNRLLTALYLPWNRYDNSDFRALPSYPPFVLLPRPELFNEKEILGVMGFRSKRRIPAIVWVHPTNGRVIARCSMPLVCFPSRLVLCPARCRACRQWSPLILKELTEMNSCMRGIRLCVPGGSLEKKQRRRREAGRNLSLLRQRATGGA